MSLQHKFKGLDGVEHNSSLDAYPDKCPSCNKGILPVFLGIHESLQFSSRQRMVSIIFRCPLSDCLTVFIGDYKQVRDSVSTYTLQETKRTAYMESPVFPEQIVRVSVSFVNIYTQASIAEINGLSEICGAGYRRALEFLVKDYLISLKPNDDMYSEEIKKIRLAACINKIDDKRIQSMARRAAWLGNDETHYYRKWEGHDLTDLKNLIEITVSWVNTSLLAKKYEEEMPDPGGGTSKT